MRAIYLNSAKSVSALLLAAMASILAGCGGSGLPPPATTSTANSIQLTTTATTLKSDGSDTTTVTALVLDANLAVRASEVLTVSASTGLLSASNIITDAMGQASFTFTAGPTGTNRTATITVSVPGTGVSSTIPIQIGGSTLTIAPTTAAVSVNTPLTLTISAKNAGGIGVSGQTLRFSSAATNTITGTLTPTTTTTDASGNATVAFSATQGGTFNAVVEWLDAAGVVTMSATRSITVNSAAGAFAFTSITAPGNVTLAPNSPVAASTNNNYVVNVSVPTPASIGGVSISNLRFSTSLGSWAITADPNCSTAGQKFCTVPVATTSATFQSGINAGNATIQVDALDLNGGVLSSLTLLMAISAPSSTASTITVQSNVAVLQPSTGANQSTATISAYVRDGTNNPVGGASVLFELVNSTGTGESISPVIVTTDSSTTATTQMGRAQTTFTAGTSTNQMNAIKATIVGTAITATTPLTVGGTAGSIALGASTTIQSVNSNTAYKLPVSVMVSDSNGNAVSGAVVSLSVWPAQYYKGYRDVNCNPMRSAPYLNEDVNQNLILNTGEDVDGPGGFPVATFLAGGAPAAGTPDNALWPAPSAAGAIVSSVTTGVDGTATFDWIYLKQYANWVDARIRATTSVQGTSSQSELVLPLAPLATDIASPCPLPDSPFN